MGKGKKIGPETEELVKATYARTENIRETARIVGIGVTTVKRIVDSVPDKLEQLRTENREKLVEEVANWEKRITERFQKSIEMAVGLSERRIMQALEGDEKLDAMIDKILDSKEIDYSQKARVIQSLSAITSIPLKDISIYIGTIFDKQALASGKPTVRSEVTNSNEYNYRIEQHLKSDPTAAELVKELHRRSRLFESTRKD